MALFKALLGNGSKEKELSEEIRGILNQIRQECARYEVLVESGRDAAERIQELTGPIARAGSEVDAVSTRVHEVEQRLAAMVELASLFETLDEKAEGLAQSQRQTDSRVSHTLEEAAQVRESLDELKQKVDGAGALRDRLEALLDADGPMHHLLGDTETLRSEIDGMGEQVARLREQHERMMNDHKVGTAKLEALDRRRDDLSRDLQDKEQRVSGVVEAVRGMDGIRGTVDDVKREIGTLKALGDSVAQKMASLEAQGEVIERALGRADQLDRAIRQIDAGLEKQSVNEKVLNAMQDQVTTLRSQHESVLAHSGEIAELQRESAERVQAVRQSLAVVRDEMKNTVERFDFESKGLESVSQRVADLRSSLTDFEGRYKGLSESSQTVADLRSQTQTVTRQLQALTADLERTDQEAQKLQGIRRDLDEAGQIAREAHTHLGQIEESRPAVAEALRDLQELRGAGAIVREALEQSQLAHEEIARARETQSATRSWLTSVEESIAELRDRVGDVRQSAPMIEAVQKSAQRISESMSAIESRRQMVEDVQSRLTELGGLGGQLLERSRELLSRMDAAEQRFEGLAAHAEEAERWSKTVAAVTSDVDRAVSETEQIGKRITSFEARCGSVDELSEKTRRLGQELEQRQRALDAAAKDLQKATELRQEAAASAEELGQLAKNLGSAVTSAERRSAKVENLASQLEDRAGNLGSVETRLAEFEERLAQWGRVEEEIVRSLDQISARQSTIESLKADLDRMFAMAEKTAADVRAITSAHREIDESRGLLDSVNNRLREVQNTASSLDERKRQLTRAEERLARVDGLLVDVRSSLETLQGQKVIVDQAVEKAGSLRFLLKQAEAMIESLREERRMTAEVHSAVALVKPVVEEDDLEEAA